MASAATASGHDPVTAQVPVKVTTNDDAAAQDQQFVFEMTPADGESAAPAESRVTVTGAGEASFSVTFDRVGEHHYSLRQIAGSADRWSYDQQVYDVTVYCMWDEKTDDLFTRVIIEDAQGYKADACTFDNHHDAPVAPEEPAEQEKKSMPQTGDMTNFGLVAVLIVLGVVAVCAGLYVSRRRRQE